MVSAPLPPDEDARLASLHSFGVLDTEFEKDYDDLCRLAAVLCGTPIALISFVDERRQWFKAVVGLEMRQTDREVSFCAHALVDHHVLEVPDATKDRRFADNPLVTHEPSIRFYAGQPLVAAEGHALGTLCVVDRVPRTLTPGQREALEILGRQVSVQLELRRTALRLQEANRTKDQLLGIVAHDLRSPLSGLLSLSGYLREEGEALTPDDRQEVVDSLHQSLLQVHDLAENLLTWALVEQGRVVKKRESLRASDLAGDVLGPLELPYRLKDVVLDVALDPGLVVEGDPDMLQAVLRNLLTNALKYSRPGSRVELSGHAEGDLVTLRVQDHGIGIPEALLQRLRHETKVTSRRGTTGETGSGLGLTLVKQFVALHHGRLEFASEPGQGTTVSVVLPATQPVAQQS